MSSTWKVVLPLVALVIGAGAVVKYKNHVAPAIETLQTEQNTVVEQRSYDLNSPSITDAEIYAVAQVASVEPSADADEDKDSNLLILDNQALNNLNNAYVSTDF